jgi:hypothetical protein
MVLDSSTLSGRKADSALAEYFRANVCRQYAVNIPQFSDSRFPVIDSGWESEIAGLP